MRFRRTFFVDMLSTAKPAPDASTHHWIATDMATVENQPGTGDEPKILIAITIARQTHAL